MLNVFVKGHLSIEVGDHVLDFQHRNLSVYGVGGLPWAPLKPEEHFGQMADIGIILLPVGGPVRLGCQGTMIRDRSLYAEHMGIRFHFKPKDKKTIQTIIKQHGFYPTEYMRKYPRIPADPALQTYPLRAMVEHSSGVDEDHPIVCEVGNLSPNGIMLSSQGLAARTILPGERLKMTLDPRGWFPTSVHVEGLVCRSLEEVDPVSQNTVRHFGVKFTRVEEEDRAAFLELLRDILEDIRVKKIKPSDPGNAPP